MSEKIEVYDENSQLIAVRDRKEYESEVKQEYIDTGKIATKLQAVRLMLLTSAGRIYLQRRSKQKSANPGLLDKSIGGHVSAGHSYNLTVVKECAEELGFPATVLMKKEFSDAIHSIEHLKTIGVFKEIDYLDNFLSKRELAGGTSIEQPYLTTMYVGYYDGPISFVDGESSGIETFSIEELKEEIHNFPEKFTEDLKFMVNNYANFYVPIGG